MDGTPHANPAPPTRSPTGHPTGHPVPYYSILVPTKNRPAMLGVALRSVVEQGFEDLEIVVVDDDPSGSAEPVAEAFEGAPIRYLRNTHTPGAAGARNCAAEAATGRFLAFLDDDDAFAPGKLELQQRALETLDPNAVLLFGGWQHFDFAADRPTGTGPARYGGWLFEELMLGNFVANLCTVVVPGHVFERIGGFDESFPALEDLDFYLRLARLGPFAYLPEVLAYRRDTAPGRMSLTPSLELLGFQRLYRRYAAEFARRPRAHHRHAARTFLAAFQAGDRGAILASLPWLLAGVIVDPANVRLLLHRTLHHRPWAGRPAAAHDRRVAG